MRDGTVFGAPIIGHHGVCRANTERADETDQAEYRRCCAPGKGESFMEAGHIKVFLSRRVVKQRGAGCSAALSSVAGTSTPEQ